MEKSVNKRYWLLLSAGITVVGFLSFLLFGHKYGYTIIEGITLLMIPAFPYCIHILYFEIKSNKWYIKSINMIIGLIWFFALLFGSLWLKNKYSEIQLEKYPKITFGKITNYETMHGKSGSSHFAVFEYQVYGEHFQQRIGNDDSFWKIEDSLKLLVSEKDPQIFKVIGYKK